MKIRIVKDLEPIEYLFNVRFRFEEFTEEEIFLFNKYGFIPVRVHDVLIQHGNIRRYTEHEEIRIDEFQKYVFLFSDEELLKGFTSEVVEQVQKRVKSYIKFLTESAGEDMYEITSAGEIRKINEGAKKVLDKNSKEYKEIIEKNREAFEKLSKL